MARARRRDEAVHVQDALTISSENARDKTCELWLIERAAVHDGKWRDFSRNEAKPLKVLTLPPMGSPYVLRIGRL